jgi:murein DD-endopeptidase MepM/ murein hydrolase activator NlpD
MFKKLVIFLRTWTKLITLLLVAIAIICFVIFFVYNPMYSVTLNGEFIGYTENKSDMQSKIDEYRKSGDSKTIAFVEIETLPEYKLCLLKKGIESNDDEIFQTVIDTGIPYYKYYAILNGSEEKYYVETYDEAEQVITDLKEKNSMNKDNISYLLKYETELKTFTGVDETVASLYVETPKVTKNTTVNTKQTVDYTNTALGLALAKPIEGTITSRFGTRSRGLHTGLDIATSLGTPIKAAASGVVTYAGYKGSYGYLVVISHGNGIETYYAHCSKLYVNAGDSVSQGSVIAAVGSTGNSTGPHLHLEIRVNGVAKNPQNYLYN